MDAYTDMNFFMEFYLSTGILNYLVLVLRNYIHLYIHWIYMDIYLLGFYVIDYACQDWKYWITFYTLIITPDSFNFKEVYIFI